MHQLEEDFNEKVGIILDVVKQLNLQCSLNKLYRVEQLFKDAFTDYRKDVIDLINYVIDEVGEQLVKELTDEELNEEMEVEVDEAVLKEDLEHLTEQVRAGAINSGKQSIILWLMEHGETFGDDELTLAAANGDVDTVRFLMEHGVNCTESSMNQGARFGNLSVVRLMYQSGCQISTETLVAAAESGDIELMEWLVSRGLILTRKVLDVASEYGHDHLVQWMKQNKHLFDENISNRDFAKALKNAVKNKRVVDEFADEFERQSGIRF